MKKKKEENEIGRFPQLSMIIFFLLLISTAAFYSCADNTSSHDAQQNNTISEPAYYEERELTTTVSNTSLQDHAWKRGILINDHYFIPPGAVCQATAYKNNFTVYCDYSDADLSAFMTIRCQNPPCITISAGNNLGPIRVQAIGDSIIADGGILSQLDKRLNSHSVKNNFGASGDLCERIANHWNINVYPNTLTIILCGINDLHFNRSIAQVEESMEEIQTEADENNNTLIWLSIGPATNESLRLKDEIQEINAWMENNFTISHHTVFVDWHHRIFNGTEGDCDMKYCNPDGLHPNALGQKLIGDAIWEDAFKNKTFDPVGPYEIAISNDEFFERYENGAARTFIKATLS